MVSRVINQGHSQIIPIPLQKSTRLMPRWQDLFRIGPLPVPMEPGIVRWGSITRYNLPKGFGQAIMQIHFILKFNQDINDIFDTFVLNPYLINTNPSTALYSNNKPIKTLFYCKRRIPAMLYIQKLAVLRFCDLFITFNGT